MGSNYFDKMKASAHKASSKTKIEPAVILAQWYLETGGGTSDVSRSANNHAGIKSSSKGRDGIYKGYAKYNSLDNFVNDYSRVMNLSYYTAVREAKGIEAQVKALHESPWAEDKAYDQKLLKVIQTNGLGTLKGGPVLDLTSPGLLDGLSSFLDVFKAPWLLGLLAVFILIKK